MSTNYKFPLHVRDSIVAALPEDTSLHGKTPELRHTYLPAAHAKALRPDRMLVVGIRGSGKSFWWSALQQPGHLAAIGRKLGLSDTTITSTGFGERSSPDMYPGKDVISSLFVKSQFDPRKVWLTVVLRLVGGNSLPTDFKSEENWEARVKWVNSHPEQVERCLFAVDNELERRSTYHLVLFDALDRTADDWKTMHALVRGLLQVLLDFRSFRRIRLKVFVRPDQIGDPSVATFPDSSKVVTQITELSWPRNELYGLFWQYLANDISRKNLFLDGCKALANAQWDRADDVWTVPETLRNDEESQRRIFHAMTGPWMGKDRRRGFPYTWLPNHLGDTRRKVSPRSFLAALRHAASDNPRSGQEYPLHYESIKRGVQEASKIRVQEIQEDYPWVREPLKSLSGITVPCKFEDIQNIWEKGKVLEELKSTIDTEGVRLPPAHLESGSQGVFNDLVDLGLFESMSDGRVNLPDVYRLGYGIGRRGGVRPVLGG